MHVCTAYSHIHKDRKICLFSLPTEELTNKFKKDQKKKKPRQGSPPKASLNDNFPACVTAEDWRARPGRWEWMALALEGGRVLDLGD